MILTRQLHYLSLVLACANLCLGGAAQAASSPVAFERTINNPHPGQGNSFGYALNTYNDNLLVGSFGSRKAYVMDIQTGAELLQLNTPETVGTPVSFGSSVLQVGNRIVVGDREVDIGGKVRVGSAYVFDGATGTPLLTIRNPTPDHFGNFAQSLETIGSRLFISSEAASTNTLGKVYVYDPLTGAQQGSLLNPQPSNGSWGFGWELEAHGTNLFVGAPGAKSSGVDGGQVYRFDGNTLAQTLTIANPHTGTEVNFGRSIDTDATRLLVGSPGFSGSGGEANVFDVNTGALLRTISNPEPGGNRRFGESVALVGNFAVIGAPGVSIPGPGNFNVGAFYVFDVNTGALLDRILDPQPGANDGFTGGDGQHNLLRVGGRLVATNYAKDISGISGAGSVNVYSVVVPEPGTVGVLGVAAILLAGRRGKLVRRG